MHESEMRSVEQAFLPACAIAAILSKAVAPLLWARAPEERVCFCFRDFLSQRACSG